MEEIVFKQSTKLTVEKNRSGLGLQLKVKTSREANLDPQGKTSSQECSQVVAKVEGHIKKKKMHLSAIYTFGLLHSLIGCVTELCFQNLPMCHIGNDLVS